MDKTVKKNRQNLYKQNYYSSKTNDVICIEFYQLGRHH